MRAVSVLLFAALVLLMGTVFMRAYELRGAYQASLFAATQARGVAARVEATLAADAVQEARASSTILFAGDVMLSRGVAGEVVRRGGDYAFPFRLIASTTAPASFFLGNLEGPLSEGGKDMGNPYSFRAAPRFVEGLLFAGFDAVTLANNHIFDWGREALRDTVGILHNADIHTVGAGRNEEEANAPLIVDLPGARVAFVGYTNLNPKSYEAQGDRAGTSNSDAEVLLAAVRRLHREADVVVVTVHWGQEYRTRATDAQRAFGEQLIDAGADLVVGHHPHVVEELQQYHGGWIAYSLGNFVFDQTFSEETNRGAMLHVNVWRHAIDSVRLAPIRINENFQPYSVPL